ncbi:sialin-like [Eupeodes corollae]|uniref:sialin-like n=1 Tax=Eupeodes corollae TaxID=290404 RepID=UPI002492C550|nr:sialin-like [Eupeodes corollae]
MIENKGPVLGARHVQAILLFLVIVIQYASRTSIAVSLVAMTDAKTTNINFHEFDWNEKEKSYILSSFFWGYILFQIPGGYAARRIGVKKTVFFSTLLSSILGLLVPFCAFWGGWKLFSFIRFLMGLSQAVLFPCVYQHVANWSPVEERNRLGAISNSGVELGTIVGMFVTGMIAASGMGWPGISYIYNGIGIVFGIFWLIFAENTPAEARFITSLERNYILDSQANIGGWQGKEIPIPWKAMLTSSPLISYLVVGMCDTWGFDTMMSQIPSYLHGTMKMDISKNAFYSALPYVSMWVCSYVSMIGADILMKNEWISLLTLRRIFATIAMSVPAGFLIGVGFINENQRGLAITFVTLNVGFSGASTIGCFLNLIDLTPNHTGIVYALQNTLASLVSIVCPIVAGLIVHDETDRSQWRILFIIAAIIYVLGNLQFLYLAQAEKQPWDHEDFMKKFETEPGVQISRPSSKKEEFSLNDEFMVIGKR